MDQTAAWHSISPVESCWPDRSQDTVLRSNLGNKKEKEEKGKEKKGGEAG